jgi:effector-binding domain-containing protein
MTATYTITEIVLPHQDTAVIRAELKATHLAEWLGSTYTTVSGYLARAQVPPAGPPFARFTFLADVVVVEAGFPVPTEVAGEGAVVPSALPDGPAVRTTHLGRYEDVEYAYQAITRWLDERGRAPAAPHWEVYYTDPAEEPDPSQWRTDVVVPYRTR